MSPLFHTMENFSAAFPRHGKLFRSFSTPWKTRTSFWMRGSALALLLASGPQARAQLGPYPIATRQATFSAELIKRDKDIVWIRRLGSDGRPMPQIGMPVSDLLGVRMPRPAVFEAAERIRTAPAAPEAQFKAAHAALDRIIVQSRPFRDIPGILADEALLLKGRLHDRKEEFREAVRLYENIITYARPGPLVTNAQILAGIAYARLGDFHFAAEYLVDKPIPEDDEELLSAQLFALGDSYFALGNTDQALLSYLTLVVFYPYVQNNEPRALAAALGCYAKLQEWEPLYRTIQEIRKNYPGTPAAVTADKFIADYKDDLVKAGQFVDGDRILPAPPAAPSAASAPASTPPKEDIEYPEGI